MSDSSSNSGRSTTSSASSAPSRGGKTKFERDVEAAQRRGVSECKDLSHWEVTRLAAPDGSLTWTDAGIKSHRDILTMMSSGKAKCSCEKKACRWAWTGNWNHKGMFQTQYVPQGLEQKGIGSVAEGFTSKKMFPLEYGLTPEEFKFLNARFPEWYFVSHNSGTHDHPVAHTSTKLATRRLMDKLERGTVDEPKIYIDLHGNPSANEAYMRRVPEVGILTFVELITPKDYVRQATKWGPEFGPDGHRRYYTTHIRDIPTLLKGLGVMVDGFISIHTSYYYDAQEIANLLQWAKPTAKFFGLMHKFDGQTGTLNMKEQEWVKRPTNFNSIITQTNLKSGESYEHPDNSWWFAHDAWCNDVTGFGWTTGMLCDESFLITATWCPPLACRMSTSCVQIKPMMKKLAHTSASAMTQDQIAEQNKIVVNIYGAIFHVDIHPRLVPFFGELRTTIIHKPRTAANFQDHVSRAKIRAKSVMSSEHITVDAQQLSDIIRCSFFIDFQDQYGWDKQMFDDAYYSTLQADPFYKNGSGVLTTGTLSVLTDMLMSAADAKNLKMGVVKAARAGISHLNRKKLLQTL